jgi:uncharacterized membrane protein
MSAQRAYYTFLLILLLCAGASEAATLSGTVYDYSLSPVPGAVVTIDTVPAQTVVAKDGTYSLTLGSGSYTLRVSMVGNDGLLQASEEQVDISREGDYTLDVILFQELPDFEEPPITSLESGRSAWWYALIPLGIAVVALGVVLFRRRTVKTLPVAAETDDLESRILAFMQQHKRTTQKELRKHFPYAEATISLALTALEKRGKVEKIKKGRGNVILLKK